MARFIMRIKHELNMTMIWIEHDMQMIAILLTASMCSITGERSSREYRKPCYAIKA